MVHSHTNNNAHSQGNATIRVTATTYKFCAGECP